MKNNITKTRIKSNSTKNKVKQSTKGKLSNTLADTVPLRKQQEVVEFTVIRPDAAGIDIGAKEIYVAVPPDRKQPVRRFGTYTVDLEELADWLEANNIKTVAMESTGVFWIPLFQLLESRGLEVFLVNARHAKAVPGRKTDVKDCQWLQHLHSVGLLDASFRPEDVIVAIRTLTRHRDGLIKTSAKYIQQMQKALTQMNIHLHHVISDISGETGLHIIDAIVDGTYDPNELIKLKSKRIKASDETLRKSLEGDYRRDLIFVLNQTLEAYRHILSLIHSCDMEIQSMVKAFNDEHSAEPIQKDDIQNKQKVKRRAKFAGDSVLHGEMKRAFGVDLTQIPGFGISTVLQVFAEVGPKGFSKFRSDAAFASWLALCPNHEITGGKVKRSKTRESKSRLAAALRQAASSLSGELGHFGNLYRRLRAKLGGAKAVTAIAHRLARLLFHLVTTGQEYDKSKFEFDEIKNRERQERALRRKAKALGFNLTAA